MGKSFLLNKIITYLLSKEVLFISAATSGITSTLLKFSKTVHSSFKVSINFNDNDTLKITKYSELGKKMMKISAIIIDEAPALNKTVYEIIDRSL